MGTRLGWPKERDKLERAHLADSRVLVHSQSWLSKHEDSLKSTMRHSPCDQFLVEVTRGNIQIFPADPHPVICLMLYVV